jgi:hypothetical protein
MCRFFRFLRWIIWVISLRVARHYCLFLKDEEVVAAAAVLGLRFARSG